MQSTGVLPRLNRRCQPTCAAQTLTQCRLLPCSPVPGLNLVLISRTESKLQDAAAELEGKHSVQVGSARLAAQLVQSDLLGRQRADFGAV